MWDLRTSSRWNATTWVCSVSSGTPSPHLSSVTAAVAGIDGTVWLRREDGLDGLARWEILSSLGELMGFAHSPPNLRLLAVRADTVWGVKRDAFGVESIVRYRIEE
jgi:hypothetical protein